MHSAMELDDMKLQLRNRIESSGSEKSAAELMQLFQKQTESAVEKILRSMLYETAFGVVMIIGLGITAWFLSSWSVRFLALVILLIMAIQVPAFYLQSRRLKAIAIGQGNLRETLKSLVFIVGEFIRLYLKYTSWLIPAAAVLGGVVGFTVGKSGIEDPALKPLDALLESHPVWGGIATVAFAALVIWGSYRYVRWAIWWSYGRYHEALQQYLKELES